MKIVITVDLKLKRLNTENALMSLIRSRMREDKQDTVAVLRLGDKIKVLLNTDHNGGSALLREQSFWSGFVVGALAGDGLDVGAHTVGRS